MVKVRTEEKDERPAESGLRYISCLRCSFVIVIVVIGESEHRREI